jgi:hypothetical protein
MDFFGMLKLELELQVQLFEVQFHRDTWVWYKYVNRKIIFMLG